MGYMGFGMRPEVYKRKPKKAFEHYRKLRKQAVYDKPSNTIDVKKRRQFFYETLDRAEKRENWLRVYKIVGILIVVVLLMVVAWSFWQAITDGRYW